MQTEVVISVSAIAQYSDDDLKSAVAQKLDIDSERVVFCKVKRRSLDSRHGVPRYHLICDVWLDEMPQEVEATELHWGDVRECEQVLIVGAGPAGLFSALELIEQGLCPIILEQGKPVRERRRDLARITKQGEVDDRSNYCFGEGGAGTFSDGKLYTRSHKRGSIERILQIFHHHGASPSILVDTHPHIGTNLLPKVVERIRQTIIASGGEIRFGTHVSGLKYDSSGVRGVILEGGEVLPSRAVVLAPGHSSRPLFYSLHKGGVGIEAKPFALGVRVEHPQALIDRIQYRSGGISEGCRLPGLPAASYSVRAQISGRGVFSFCMCPGGIICPAATANDEVVVNGWSPSKRNSPFSNSGIVVEIPVEEFAGGSDEMPVAGIGFQREIEIRAALAGGGKQVAPAQRLTDFVQGKHSQSLPKSSYIPGLACAQLSEVLPQIVGERLRAAFKHFGTQLKGYLTEEAVVVGVESRTSSPIRIPRLPKELYHPDIPGFFPAGEGAGYAGGIISAALDGQRVSKAVRSYLSGAASF